MSRLRLWAIAYLLVTASCATTRRPLGETTQLPEELTWCSKTSREKHASIPNNAGPDCSSDPAFCRESSERMKTCLRYLYREIATERANGRIILGITSSSGGKLTNVCLISSNFGDIPNTLECVARIARNWSPQVVPNLHEEPWRINLIIE
jgi:hypothetical protein